jgi:hypothetical protein
MLLTDLSQAEAVLKSHPGIKQVYLQDEDHQCRQTAAHHIDIEFEGDTAATADLLEALVQAGIRLVSFSEVTTDLEEAFLRLTKGEVT